MAEKKLGSQGRQTFSPTAFPALPAGQGEQDSESALPCENDATGQSPVGSERDAAAQCFPGGQGVHAAEVALPAEYEPAWQIPLTAERPVPEQYFPGGQGVGATLPAPSQYVPIGHGVQDGACAPPYENEPAWQSPITEASLLQYFPAGQIVIPQAAPEDSWEHICPLDTLLDRMESMLVETTTLDEFSEVILPMVKPKSVTMIAVLAESVAPEVVMTIEVAPVALIAAKVTALEETEPVARALMLKKPVGYDRVMLLPDARDPPAVGVKVNVAATPDIPMTR